MAIYFGGSRTDTIQRDAKIVTMDYTGSQIFKRRIKAGTVLMDNLYQCNWVPGYMGAPTPAVTAGHTLTLPEKFAYLDSGIEIGFGTVSDNYETGYVVSNDFDHSHVIVSTTVGYEQYNHVTITKDQLMGNQAVSWSIPGYKINLADRATAKFEPDVTTNSINIEAVDGTYLHQYMVPIIKSVTAI